MDSIICFEDFSIIQLRVLVTVASFVLAICGCFLARHVQVWRHGGDLQEMVLVGGNTLSSGVLLAASLTHMLPDAIEALEDVGGKFPLASAIAGSSFIFLVILGEALSESLPTREDPHIQTACVTYEASFAFWPRRELVPPHGCEHKVASMADEHGQMERSATVPRGCELDWARVDLHERLLNNDLSPDSLSLRAVPETFSRAAASPDDIVEAPPIPVGVAKREASRKKHSCHSHSSCCRVHQHSDTPCSELPVSRGQKGLRSWGSAHLNPFPDGGARGKEERASLARHHHHNSAITSYDESDSNGHGHSHEGCNDMPPQKRRGPSPSHCHIRGVGGGAKLEMKSFLLFFALSFHSVMEGLGLGSAEDAGALLSVALAILMHKALAAFALGCTLSQVVLEDWKFMAFVFLFAVGTPVGAAFGALTVEFSTVRRNVASGVCTALAAGTFLQVASMELLPRVLAEEKHKLVGSAGLVFGFGAMSALALWV